MIMAPPPPPPPLPPSPPKPPLSPAPPLAQVKNCFAFSNNFQESQVTSFQIPCNTSTNPTCTTDGRGIKPTDGTAFQKCIVTLPPGGTLVFGTGGLPGAWSNGNTYVWLTSITGSAVLQSGPGGGVVRYTAPLVRSR